MNIEQREIAEDIARGRLIAAAPFMLKTLKEARNVLALNGGKNDRALLLGMVRAAIRKAEGEG